MAIVDADNLPYQVKSFRRLSATVIQLTIGEMVFKAYWNEAIEKFELPNNIPAEIADMFDNPQPHPKKARRQAIVIKLNGLRGKTVAELDDVELRELVEVLLYTLKMINPQGRITGGKPFDG